MSWQRMNAVVAVLGALLPVLAPVSSQWTGPEDRGYVKYYEVGPGETLPSIAGRLLGSADRAGELLALNQGRVQPDGERLTDPFALNAGWLLVLPWDAAGDDVRYGLLPANAPPGAGSAPDESCLVGVATGSGAGGQPDDWAARILSVPQAWRITRGGGVVVGVIDSGVNADVAELAGRVMPGADITKGTSSGDTDCLGSGTAIASLIAARRAEGRPLTGVAPEATIMPLRVTHGTTVNPADAATAIEVAVAAGARVIAIGATVPVDAGPVADAITVAIAHDTVVVIGAGPTGAHEPGATHHTRSAMAAGPGLLRAAAVDQGGRLVSPLLPADADLVAPGVAVAALTPSGSVVPVTGDSYAAALVAGTAALVRAAAPSLTAAQVTELLLATAAESGAWRYLDPAAAVVAAAERNQPALGPGATSDRDLMSLLWAALLVIGAVLMGFLLARRLSRRRQDPLVSYFDELPGSASTVDLRIPIAGSEKTVELQPNPERSPLTEATTLTVGRPPDSVSGNRDPARPDSATVAPSAETTTPAPAPLRRPHTP